MFKNGKFGPAAKMPAPNIHGKPGGGKPGEVAKDGAPKPAPSGAEEPQHSSAHGSQPHPQTGVHSVHVHHMGGGKAMTHTHHSGGHVEKADHASLDEAKQHQEEMLPSMAGEHAEPDADEFAGAMSAIGGKEPEVA